MATGLAGPALPPLLLQDDEAVAVAVGLRACAGQAVAGIDEASLRALTKLSRVLPSRLRHRVQSLSASTTVLPPDQQSQVDADVLTVLAAATANHERLWMRYAARDGHTQQRHVEPVQLVAAGRRWYLLAFDVDRDDWRTFRVDRVADQPTGGRAVHREPPGGDVERYLSQARMEMAPTYRADVTLWLPEAEARTQLADQLANSNLIADGQDRCRWVTPLDTIDWLMLRILAGLFLRRTRTLERSTTCATSPPESSTASPATGRHEHGRGAGRREESLTRAVMSTGE